MGAPLLARNEQGDWDIMGTYVDYIGESECVQGGAFARMDVFAQNRAYQFLGREPEPEDDHAGVPDNATALAPGARGEGRRESPTATGCPASLSSGGRGPPCTVAVRSKKQSRQSDHVSTGIGEHLAPEFATAPGSRSRWGTPLISTELYVLLCRYSGTYS